jgi:hypothetical protein
MNVLTVQWSSSTYALVCCLLVTIRGLVGPSHGKYFNSLRPTNRRLFDKRVVLDSLKLKSAFNFTFTPGNLSMGLPDVCDLTIREARVAVSPHLEDEQVRHPPGVRVLEELRTSSTGSSSCLISTSFSPSYSRICSSASSFTALMRFITVGIGRRFNFLASWVHQGLNTGTFTNTCCISSTVYTLHHLPTTLYRHRQDYYHPE